MRIMNCLKCNATMGIGITGGTTAWKCWDCGHLHVTDTAVYPSEAPFAAPPKARADNGTNNINDRPLFAAKRC